MISFEEALQTVLSQALPLGIDRVKLSQATGNYLACDIQTTEAIPRFDNSAVDGYGVKASDTSNASATSPVRLPVTQTISAGECQVVPLEAGCAVRIFTGGPIPPGVNAVVMREDVEESDSIIVKRPVPLSAHIRRAGEEFKSGETVVTAGSRITPGMIGLLALLGISTIEVFRRPSIALIVTGNELMPVGEPLSSTQVYDSNTVSLRSALEATGVKTVDSYLIEDSIERLQTCLRQALEDHDIVITAGGVSMGDRDYVRTVLTSIGVQQRYWQVAIKPGKPNYFGTYEVGQKKQKLVFGLPGNPVSALVSFLLFVKPALRKMMGDCRPIAELISAKLSNEIHSEIGRLEFLRGRLSVVNEEWTVEPAVKQGSHMLTGLATADCLIHCPSEIDYIAAGEAVQVQRIDWY